MGQLKVLKTGPLATIQDLGRTGFRRYGIPQSGAVDRVGMITANRRVGNPDHYPVVEFALQGMILEGITPSFVVAVGTTLKVNGQKVGGIRHHLAEGDRITLSPPSHVYAYLAIGGLLDAQKDFGSYSTYERAGFGGLHGCSLTRNDMLATDGSFADSRSDEFFSRSIHATTAIRIMQGPEWEILKELPETKSFRVASDSDRMGIRLAGERLDADFREIQSSAVVPGTVQLPPDGRPIILMNDCQTTGGYPRIGKVLEEDLGKVAQIKPGSKLVLTCSA